MSIRTGRHGYTLLEILVATTLALLLMYAVAAVFSQIGSLMSQTQNVMGMSVNLRSTRDRLEKDLSLLTVPKLKAPSSQYGYFCYTEGLGADDHRVLENRAPFRPSDSAQDIENGGVDTTVGDNDDILSFTAKAPAGEWFRGRLAGEVIESEYAEIIWFLRGTTLYRRVLLIVPDDVLQGKITTLEITALESEGYGFFYNNDISVHLNSEGKIVANTLKDLANRKNRYGIWSSPVVNAEQITAAGSNSPLDSRHGIWNYTDVSENPEGKGYFAWYWLRMPTLQESAALGTDRLTGIFRAGEPFGNINDPANWPGTFQLLTDNRNLNSTELPNSGPFIDYWGNPNLWSQVDTDSGDLSQAIYPDGNTLNPVKLFTQDVILTNVLAFDVKVWEEETYIDLGAGSNIPNTPEETDVQSFASYGFYINREPIPCYGQNTSAEGIQTTVDNPHELTKNNNLYRLNSPFLPAVFDTWTEEYQKEQMQNVFTDETGTFNNVTRKKGYAVTDIPLNGEVTSAVLPDYPPPYDKELKGLSIEIRAFDPVSRSLKNVTLKVDFTRR